MWLRKRKSPPGGGLGEAMNKPDYSDLESVEGFKYVFGFLGIVGGIVFVIWLLVYSLLG